MYVCEEVCKSKYVVVGYDLMGFFDLITLNEILHIFMIFIEFTYMQPNLLEMANVTSVKMIKELGYKKNYQKWFHILRNLFTSCF